MRWIEARTGLGELVKVGLDSWRVPKNVTVSQTLGCVTLAAFLLQMFTGFCLLLYYVPDSEQAFASVQSIMRDIPYGWLFRAMHAAGGVLLLITVTLHMLSGFVMGSYRNPRELTWITGCLLFFTAVLFAFSGNLLPWSQLHYWQTVVATAIPSAVPSLGEFLTRVLRNGTQVSDLTLARFFALHVSVLPFVFFLLVALHLLLVWRTGIASPPFGDGPAERGTRTGYWRERHPDGLPFYPEFISRAAFMVAVYCSILFLVMTFLPGLFFSGESLVPANPLKTPSHIRPEWYVLAPYQLLKIIPSTLVAVGILAVMKVLFVFWPFFDTGKQENIFRRPLLFVVTLSVIAVWLALTIWGRY